MPTQTVDRVDRRLRSQISLGGIERQGVGRQLPGHHQPGRRPFQRDGNVEFLVANELCSVAVTSSISRSGCLSRSAPNFGVRTKAPNPSGAAMRTVPRSDPVSDV